MDQQVGKILFLKLRMDCLKYSHSTNSYSYKNLPQFSKEKKVLCNSWTYKWFIIFVARGIHKSTLSMFRIFEQNYYDVLLYISSGLPDSFKQECFPRVTFSKRLNSASSRTAIIAEKLALCTGKSFSNLVSPYD